MESKTLVEGDRRRVGHGHDEIKGGHHPSPARNTHIRNPEPNQWKKTFTDRTEARFEELYLGLVERTGYACA